MSYLNYFNTPIEVGTFNSQDVNLDGVEINPGTGPGMTLTQSVPGENFVASKPGLLVQEQTYVPFVGSFASVNQIIYASGDASLLEGNPDYLYTASTQTFSVPQLANLNLFSTVTNQGFTNTIVVQGTTDYSLSTVNSSALGFSAPVRKMMEINIPSVGTGVPRNIVNNFGAGDQTLINMDVAGGGAQVVFNNSTLYINPNNITQIVNQGPRTAVFIVDYEIDWLDQGANWDNHGGCTTTTPASGTGYGGRRSIAVIKNGNFTNGIMGINTGRFCESDQVSTAQQGSCAVVLAANEYIQFAANQSAKNKTILYPSMYITITQI